MNRIILMLLSLSFVMVSQAAELTGLKDSLLNQQWHLHNAGQLILRSSGELTRDRLEGIAGADINWVTPKEVAPKITDSKREVIVAVLDTGIDLLHPDLLGRVWYDNKRCANNQVHDAENACHGFNFIEMNSNISDDVGHGTHVAGLIAANLNDFGVAGVTSSQVKIMPIKVVNNQTRDFVQNGRMITDIFADGIRYALQNGADVINISLGWPKLVETPKIRIAITKAIEEGVVIIAASGNNGKDVPTFPCSYEGVICVGAMDNQGNLAEYSNFGGKIDLMAPGENIISTFPANLESRSLGIQGYEVKQGSSQAAPLVSAVAATLKLLHPEITLKEIQARLFTSSLKKTNNKEEKDRFVRFGALNMREALESSVPNLVAPSFKDILTVNVDKELGFEINLPIINYVRDLKDVLVEVRLLTSAAKLEQTSFKLPEVLVAKNERISLKGLILDQAADSQTLLEVKVSAQGQILSQTQTMISFAKELEHAQKFSLPLAGVDHRLVSFFSEARKSSRLQRVLDRFSLIKAPEFSYVDPRKVTEDKYVLSLLQLKTSGKSYQSIDLELPSLSQVLKVFVMDYNNDSNPDYMVYSLSKDKKDLILSFFSYDGKPLYGDRSHWFWPISTFEGLPQEGDREDFEYYQVELPGVGKVLSPAMNKTWELPDLDNTQHILDRLPQKGVEHIYYLRPEVKKGRVEISVRALTGWTFVSDLQDRFSLFADEVINFSKPLRQTLAEAKLGRLRVPLAIGSEARKDNYIVEFSSQSAKYSAIQGPPLVVEDNNRFAIENLSSTKETNEHLLFALSGRTTGRVTRLNQKAQLSSSYVMRRSSWGDPFFSIIGSFKNDHDYWYFMESRYKIIASTESGKSFELPLNRDSSFPGVQFSETLKTTAVESSGELRPGVVIDSTLVYGDRIYTMVAHDDNFIRPIKLSLETSAECIPSGTGALEQDGQNVPVMIYLCRDRFLNMRFEMVPLAI